MNKETFMEELEAGLKGLGKHERSEIIQDFDEHFSNGLAEGKTEHQIAADLGSPRQIAKEMRAEVHMEKVQNKASAGNVMRAVWAVFGLSLFNLIIVLGPFVALASVVAAGWITGVSFAGSPLLVILNAVLQPETFIWFDMFFSMVLAGIGVLMIIGMFYLTRVMVKGFIKYLRFNMNMVKGGMEHA